MGNNMKNEARPPRRLETPGTVVSNAKRYTCQQRCRHEDRTVVVLYICWRSIIHSAISPAEKDHKCLPRGPACFKSMRGVLCCLRPRHIHAVLVKHTKTRNTSAANGSIFGREKSNTPNVEPSRLNGVFWKGYVDPSYMIPVLNFSTFTLFSCHDSRKSSKIPTMRSFYTRWNERLRSTQKIQRFLSIF